MNMIENDVFTAVAVKLRSTYDPSYIYVTGEYTPTPPRFPCVFIYETDNFNAGFNGCNDEVVTGVMYTVEVYTNKLNGKKSEAKEIMQTIDSVMTSLGFTRTMMQQIPNLTDASIFRITARYSASVINNVIYRR